MRAATASFSVNLIQQEIAAKPGCSWTLKGNEKRVLEEGKGKKGKVKNGGGLAFQGVCNKLDALLYLFWLQKATGGE